MYQRLLHPLTFIITISLALGVLLHDTKIDKATSVALVAPTILSIAYAETKQVGLSGDPHTHHERVSFSQTLHSLHSKNPQLHPKRHGNKKYLLQKYAHKGYHKFDNYNLPIV